MSNLIPVSGNTYPVKDQIKALGGRWNAAQKCWMVPEDNADAAYRLVQAAPKSTYKSKPKSRGTWTGCSCGSVEEYERPGDCFTCRHDRY